MDTRIVKLLRLAAAGCLLTLAGCSIAELLYPPATQLGDIGKGNGIAVPDSVTRGVAFAVSIETRGNACLQGVARTDVRYIARDTGVVEPYDRVAQWHCAGDVLLVLRHSAVVTFTNPGPAVIQFRGIDGTGDSVVVITRSVIVH